MLNSLFIIIFAFLLSFFPIMIWAYIFSCIDDTSLNKKRFLVWIIGWILSVFPILYMNRILDFFNFKYLNIFYFISQIKSLFSSLEFGFSLSIFLLILAIFSFLWWFFIRKNLEVFKVYFKNIIVFLTFIFFTSLVVYLLTFVSYLDFVISDPIYFWNIIFNTFKLVIFYYLLVAFIEEASKHFNFLQSSVLHIDSIKTWVLYSIFVALWFSFIENILYFTSIYNQTWISYELLKVYFFRSIFSSMVHILCSSVVAYYFSRALLLYRGKDLSLPYLKIFLLGLSISILLHLLFNVFLTLNFPFVLFIYFIWGYLYVSSIFYRD